MTLVGVDGCSGGWICVVSKGPSDTAFVVPAIRELFARISQPSVVAVDIPIGLTETGPRRCDMEARRLLGQPRGTSVFPAPVRASLAGHTHAEASDLHEQADGRRLTRQAFGILRKIQEVDRLLCREPTLPEVFREIHPELSFSLWNEGHPMLYRKSRLAGRSEREALIEKHWPGRRAHFVEQLRGAAYKPDDLNDALAALWTAERIHAGTALVLPTEPARDHLGLKMEMSA